MITKNKIKEKDSCLHENITPVYDLPVYDLPVFHINLGRTNFKEVWNLQSQLNIYKQKNKYNDFIISNQHEHVYTLGKAGNKNHFLLNKSVRRGGENNKISFYEIDRGGDITYHGPGQLVIYPIFDLNNYYRDAHKYLRCLEEVIIITLKNFGIEGYREEGYTGVWVNDEKICAIGIKISKWITMHGLAFNINTDLSFFNKIIPCGIFHKGVTSLSKLIGKEIDINFVNQKVIENFEKVFQIKIKNINLSDIELSELELYSNESV